MLKQMWSKVTGYFAPKVSDEEIAARLADLRDKTPAPLFWLFGRTQSGKSSVVKYLTGADRAEVGRGFRPCTKFSAIYHFPSEETPLMRFLDTRGLGEPGYDPSEDLAAFDDQAHIVIVTVKLLDHAQEKTFAELQKLRDAKPSRPVVLVLTCLHEAYPQQQHPTPYPFDAAGNVVEGATVHPVLSDSLSAQKQRFGPLVDRVVCVDLTPAEEGFADPEYGGPVLREVLLELLPAAQGQTLRGLELAQANLRDLFAAKAVPTIVAYSTLAGTAGAVPVPVMDLVLISSVQTRMVYDLAKLYGQPLTPSRFAELAGALGVGLLTRQAGRSLIKLIPGLGTVAGSVAGGGLAAASTYALGQAFCYYYSAVLKGHNPDPKDLRRFYDDQLTRAKTAWADMRKESHP